ncbi:MAG: hypothetical protein M0Z98_04080 [Actinomycetales bacterium]|nr:hypothetical protein [Actinomycetales bacterium]
MTALRLLPEFEAALRAVPGIRDASVRTGPDAHPIEVHVVAGDLKPAKQVVRDVQSVAMAQFDLDIDHRIVSVVQIPDGAVEAGDASDVREDATEEALPRPALMSIVTHRSEAETAVDVQLGIAGAVFSGRADGPSGNLHRPRIVASATLAALSELLGIPAQVESAQVLEVGNREVALTTVILTIPRLGDQVLCGSALVRADPEDAVARSVLAAVNRRLAG